MHSTLSCSYQIRNLTCVPCLEPGLLRPETRNSSRQCTAAATAKQEAWRATSHGRRLAERRISALTPGAHPVLPSPLAQPQAREAQSDASPPLLPVKQVRRDPRRRYRSSQRPLGESAARCTSRELRIIPRPCAQVERQAGGCRFSAFGVKHAERHVEHVLAVVLAVVGRIEPSERATD